MKVLLQWTQRNPRDWIELPAEAWQALPSRPVPADGAVGAQDNQPGYVFDLNVQGVTFSGQDHYAVEPIGDGVRVTIWNDDPADYPPGEEHAQVWTFLSLAPDQKMGDAINTRQSRIIYAHRAYFEERFGESENTEWRPWEEFVTPAPTVTRHGIWVQDADAQRHWGACARRGWREWTDGLALSELDETGQVRTQRDLGRYNRPLGTKTYYQRDTARAVGFATVTNELASESTTGTPATITATIPALTGVKFCAFTSPTGEPGSADWPSGTYRAQIDCTVAGVDLTYAWGGLSGAIAGIERISADTNTSHEGTNQTENAFAGTGLKLGTSSWDPAAGSADDLLSCVLHVLNSNTMMSQDITIRVNTTDSFVDGPWTAAPTPSLALPRNDRDILASRELDPWPGRVT